MTRSSESELSRADLMRIMETNATLYRPKMFAIYGVYKENNILPQPDGFVGWGIEFGTNRGAIYWDPSDRTLHSSDSAEQALAFHRRIADANLLWFD